MDDEKIYILENMSKATLYEQLAEECSELTHACLKMSRFLRMENPTPYNEEFILDSLVEEASDVRLLMDILNLKPSDEIIEKKTKRWINRIDKMKGNTR